ncbi:hypothetical protein KUCAC02_021245, partial [Chaenocephalus aceratus]
HAHPQLKEGRGRRGREKLPVPPGCLSPSEPPVNKGASHIVGLCEDASPTPRSTLQSKHMSPQLYPYAT